MSHQSFRNTLLAVLFSAVSAGAQTTYTTVSIPSNNDIQTNLISSFPSGQFATDLNTPFSIPNSPGNCGVSGAAPCNFFDAFTNSGSGQSITMNVSIDSPTDAYTLMNAYDPAPGQQLAAITFTGSSGASLTFPIIAGDTIRDFYVNTFANSLNNQTSGVSAQNIFTCNDPSNCLGGGGTGDVQDGGQGNYVIDEQHYSLGSTFIGQTLIQITLADTYNGSTPILLGLTVGAQPALTANGVATVNGASFAAGQPVAADSIASSFGADLANQTASVSGSLETSLGGATVTITDSTGVSQLAPLFYVSPSQVNLQVPPGVANGAATLEVNSADGAVSVGTVNIATVAPGIFSANNLALAYSLSSVSGQSVYTLTVQPDPNNPGQYVPAPIQLDPSGTYLVLFGTGIRNAALADVSVQIGAVTLVPAYAGAQPEFAGEDQINVLLPPSLAGSGDNTIVVTVVGVEANPVDITIQ